MRRFVGNDYRYLVPGSAVAGALLLLLADTFGRSVAAPIILPIGAITSFWGRPCSCFCCSKEERTMVKVKNITYAYSRTSGSVLDQVGFR